MNRVELGRLLDRETARKTLVGERVPELAPTLTDATIVTDAETGTAVLMYAPLEGDTKPLRWAVRNVNTGSGVYRSGMGYRQRSAVFGNAPRKPLIQRESCRASRVTNEQPEIAEILAVWAGRLQAALDRELPDAVADGQEQSAAILPDWRLTDATLWTSGVVNNTVPMPYHTDTANFDVWSAMPVFRRGVSGGHLHLPEYGAVVECHDGWAVWFPGYRHVHGVTPIEKRQPDGYRFSAVYYALRGMKDCGTVAQEAVHARVGRTERERKAAADLAARLVNP